MTHWATLSYGLPPFLHGGRKSEFTSHRTSPMSEPITVVMCLKSMWAISSLGW